MSLQTDKEQLQPQKMVIVLQTLPLHCMPLIRNPLSVHATDSDTPNHVG